MGDAYDYRKFRVLYVDDEERSLKYFRRDFESDFQVLTCASADAALRILADKGNEVGILIADQRMPGMTGVELLGKIRFSWPYVVRILATAYSDLDSAIDAVNTGAVYRYIVKPWNMTDLRVLLLRAMEFSLLQRERDHLVQEKLTVLQRMIVVDRMRSLLVLAAALEPHVRNSTRALSAFFNAAPPEALTASTSVGTMGAHFEKDLLSLARDEIRLVLHVARGVSESVMGAEANPTHGPAEEVLLQDVLRTVLARFAEGAAEGRPGFVTIIPENSPVLRANRAMLERCFAILIRSILRQSSGCEEVLIRAEDAESILDTPGVRVLVSAKGTEWTREQVAALFHPLTVRADPAGHRDFGLLAAFFLVHHHGGGIRVLSACSAGAGFEVSLPYHPAGTERQDAEAHLVEQMLARLDPWRNLAGGAYGPELGHQASEGSDVEKE